MHFSFENFVPFQVFKDFSVENLETIPSILPSNFFSEIYLSRIINYWGSIFTLYLTRGTFSLVCVLSVFFLSFVLLFFFFYRYFPWQALTIHKITRNKEGIIIFLVFHFYQLTSIHLVDQDFYHFFFIDLFCNYQSDSWWDMFYLEICILFAFSLMQLSRSYWLSYFKVTLWESELIQTFTLPLQSKRLKPTCVNTPSPHCLSITPTQPYH